MSTITEIPGRIFSTEKANILADKLNATDEDGFTYNVEVNPMNAETAIIRVYDFDDNYIGIL